MFARWIEGIPWRGILMELKLKGAFGKWCRCREVEHAGVPTHKYDHFCKFEHHFKASMVANILMNNMFKLHDIPQSSQLWCHITKNEFKLIIVYKKYKLNLYRFLNFTNFLIYFNILFICGGPFGSFWLERKWYWRWNYVVGSGDSGCVGSFVRYGSVMPSILGTKRS